LKKLSLQFRYRRKEGGYSRAMGAGGDETGLQVGGLEAEGGGLQRGEKEGGSSGAKFFSLIFVNPLFPRIVHPRFERRLFLNHRIAL
jgi:hypothetical protein